MLYSNMTINRQLKVLFVINPISGGKQNKDWEEEINNRFNDSPNQISIHKLKGEDDESELKNNIAKYKPHKVVAVGGDGTIKMVAEQLLNTDITLGILPAGSANGMAKELGISEDVDEALQIINNGAVKKIDVIRINDREISIHLSDIGLNALLIKHYENNEVRGMWGYAKAIFRVLSEKRYMLVEITTSEDHLVRSAYMVVLANSRTYGTGAIINPEGDLYDGKFELVIVRRLSIRELLKMVITHKPFDPDKIEIVQTDQVSITLRHHAYFQVDGEYRGKVKGLQAKILPASLSIMLPLDKEPENIVKGDSN
jgi:YegS/Rv2252/BmrU family lipid kinase